MEEYICLLGKCILRLKPDIVIHRLTGDGSKELLAAPLWTGAKRTVLNRLHQYLKENHIWQGKEYHGLNIHIIQTDHTVHAEKGRFSPYYLADLRVRAG